MTTTHAQDSSVDPRQVVPPVRRLGGDEASASDRSQTEGRRAMTPLNLNDLWLRADTAWREAWFNTERHDVLASRWNVVDTWARLLVALAASLSALSLFAENSAMTAVLAVTAAVVSALNAAWDPAQRAAKHRLAAREFRHVEKSFGDIANAARPGLETKYFATAVVDPVTGEPRGPDEYNIVGVPPEVFKQLSRALVRDEGALEGIRDNAPQLNRLIGQPVDGIPRTKWGLRRMEHRYERQLKAAEINRRFQSQMAADSLGEQPAAPLS